MRFLVLFLGCVWAFGVQAIEGIKVDDFKAAAIVHIQKEYPNVAPDDLVFYDLDISVLDNDLQKSRLRLGFVDESSRHSTGSSPYAYDTYIVNFKLISGDFVRAHKGFWGGFESVSGDAIK
ncbi:MULTISPECIES: hypothetical protein [Marinobacter]|uniref:hypothetical protein n=1 Tax=unclassified Marinobacter TaxID=83889 RepID=UPI001C606814|nr:MULTISPECIES: hypothetical protein [unclassified Marinobacter]MBW4936171.1 hypothetical protein [Marinobacter sp. F4206]MBW7469465.1 hypothetical protein [Marinobacter sp. F4218]